MVLLFWARAALRRVQELLPSLQRVLSLSTIQFPTGALETLEALASLHSSLALPKLLLVWHLPIPLRVFPMLILALAVLQPVAEPVPADSAMRC